MAFLSLSLAAADSLTMSGRYLAYLNTGRRHALSRSPSLALPMPPRLSRDDAFSGLRCFD